MQSKTHATSERIAGPDRARGDLLDVHTVCELLGGCSVRHVYRLADAGKMPRPVKLGSLVRWRTDELRLWIADGCPSCRTAKGGIR